MSKEKNSSKNEAINLKKKLKEQLSDDEFRKVQIIDEAQRVISFGSGGNSGDFEYMELSRSFRE